MLPTMIYDEGCSTCWCVSSKQSTAVHAADLVNTLKSAIKCILRRDQH